MNKKERMELYYDLFNKAIRGQIKSCFNCKHSIFHPPETEYFTTEVIRHVYRTHVVTHHEWAECTLEELQRNYDLWGEIEEKVEQHPYYQDNWNHYHAFYCPCYEALTDEEREKRFKDYL